jgi:hypothetical protein
VRVACGQPIKNTACDPQDVPFQSFARLKSRAALPNSTGGNDLREHMKDEHFTDEPNTALHLARAECAALLLRLRQAPPPPQASATRLLRVRAAIATGEFHVDARNVAERLIRRKRTPD